MATLLQLDQGRGTQLICYAAGEVKQSLELASILAVQIVSWSYC